MLKRFKGPAILIAAASASSVAAHDFWVQPSAYWLAPQTTSPVAIMVGHGPDRQRSQISLSRITRFVAISPDGETIDLRPNLKRTEAGLQGDIGLRPPGAYVLALETDATAQSHLPAIKFNAYLNDEGLTPAIAARTQARHMAAEGSENYGRRAKAIVQVGPPGGPQTIVTRPVGYSLEIVPECSPYAVPQSATLPVRVFYEGQPLAGALVKFTNLEHDEAPVETHRTDKSGRAVFAMPKTGNWMLNVVWTKPLPSDRETDFETTFSSLSFGFPTLR
ncbi:MAG: DUF4198 domain-containing protein [Usitatibacteraceae bacterium]